MSRNNIIKTNGLVKKKEKGSYIRLTDTTEPICAIVDRTEDIAVLRAKLEAVNQLCQRFEDGLHQTKEAVETRCVDLILSVDDGCQPGMIARTASDQLARMVMNVRPPSIITSEWQHALAAMPAAWHSRVGTLFWAAVAQQHDVQPQNCTSLPDDTNERLVNVVLTNVSTGVDLLNELLVPIRRLRDLLIATVNEKQVATTAAPKVRDRGRPKDASLPARNKRIRELKRIHCVSDAKLAEIVNQDPEIQNLGLKDRITAHVVREVLHPSRKKKKDKPGKK